jgi:hypothetical protein
MKKLNKRNISTMKVKLFLMAAGLVSVGTVLGQKVKVDVSNQSIGGGRHEAFVTAIYHSNESEVKKEWKALLKKYNPEKIKGGGEIVADNATISSISSNSIDIYATIKESGGEVELVVAFDLGGAFVDGAHSGAKTAEDMVYDFAVEMTTAGIEAEVKDAEKVLAAKEKEVDKLVKANDRLHQNIARWNGEIESATQSIKQAESDLEANEKEQDAAKKVVEEQEKAVQAVADKLKEVK